MKAYIDPGTGSMLFAILRGVIGAAGFIIRNGITKARFLMTGGRAKHDSGVKTPFVIFSDDKRYWQTFEPICRELDKKGFDVTYMTSSPDDSVLDNPYPHIHGEFIGTGNKAFAKLNFLKAKVVFATTPGLGVYQWKRSKEVEYYVHIMHAPKDITMYHMFGVDYFDSILLSGEFQIDQVRKLEKLRDLPEKELALVGIPYMDEMADRLARDNVPQNDPKNVLLAPSWGKSGILSRFGSPFIKKLLDTGHHIIVRPHPQSVASEKSLLDKLMSEFPDSESIEWNYDSDNYEVLKRSDILISDFSGVLLEFSLIYDKPVIYANTEFDSSPYDAWWLDEEPWIFGAMARLGVEIKEDNLDDIADIIDDCMNNPKYSSNRKAVRDEIWVNYGCGAEAAADYLINKYNELSKKSDESTKGSDRLSEKTDEFSEESDESSGKED